MFYILTKYEEKWRTHLIPRPPTHPPTNPPTPSNKTFSSFQKGLFTLVFLKPREPFPIPIKWKEYSIGPLGSLRADSLRGIKHFVEKKIEKPYSFLKGSKDLLTPINGKSINWTPSEILRISLRGIKHFVEKKFEKPYWFLKGAKDLLTPINGKSINRTPSEILRISLQGIKHFGRKKKLRNLIDFWKALKIYEPQ